MITAMHQGTIINMVWATLIRQQQGQGKVLQILVAMDRPLTKQPIEI